MKSSLLLLTVLLGLGGIFCPALFGQPANAKAPPQAYLRYLCAAGGNVPAEVFGEWPRYQPPRRLILEGGSSGPLVLASNFLPLSAAGYQIIPPVPGKIVVQELPQEPAGKSTPKSIAFINFQPKAGRFYTLLIRGDGAVTEMNLLEDEPAVLPPAKEGEEPPPPRRSLRCLVLESGVKARVSCPEAGIEIEAGPDNPVSAENLQKGVWSLEISGQHKNQPFGTTVELDLETPGNWTLFFMKDIYGRIGPTLRKDAHLD